MGLSCWEQERLIKKDIFLEGVGIGWEWRILVPRGNETGCQKRGGMSLIDKVYLYGSRLFRVGGGGNDSVGQEVKL